MKSKLYQILKKLYNTFLRPIVRLYKRRPRFSTTGKLQQMDARFEARQIQMEQKIQELSDTQTALANSIEKLCVAITSNQPINRK